MEIPQKIKNKSIIRSNYSISGYLSKEHKNTNSKRYMHPYAHCSISYNSQDMEKPKCPSMDEWVKNMWYIYTMEYCSAIKKNEILPFVITWMDLESKISELSRMEKDKYHVISLICGILKKPNK